MVASSLAESFSDSGMGVVQSAVPNGDLAMVYAVEFALVRGIMSGNMEEHLKKITSPLNNNSDR